MAVAVTHATTAAGPNDPSKQVSSDAWNAGHTITGLATVASSGLYSDLSGTPTLATVATTGAYADLSGKPTLGSLASVSSLTGPITSVGAATSITAQTGTGTTFAMSAGPTFTGTTTVATLIASTTPATLGDGSGATFVLASNLSGANDPAITFADAAVQIRPIGTSTINQWFGNVGLNLGGSTGLGWCSGSSATASPDTVITRDGAANTVAQRNGTNAQVTRVYNTFTDVSNYERGKLSWESNFWVIGAEAAGTGTLRSIILRTGPSNGWQIDTSNNFLARTDNVQDIGATAAQRPRHVYVAGVVVASNAPGSITIADENYSVMARRLTLTSTQQAVLAGTGRMVIL